MDFPEPKQWNGAPGERMGDVDYPSYQQPVKCLDCGKTFRDAYSHHKETHHRMAYKHRPDLILEFSCCRPLCRKCNASITGTDSSVGFCTQCGGKL